MNRSRNARAGGSRPGAQETGEEIEIWEQTKSSIAELSRNELKSKEMATQIIELETTMKAAELAGRKASIEEIDSLKALYRAMAIATERSAEILKEEDLLTKISILQGVVKHTEDMEAAASRSSRETRAAMEFDGPSDSPVPSPAENKHIRKHAGQPRTSSQPPSVKDDRDEKESSNPSRTKIVFAMGAEVAFKPKVQGQSEEHDWIQGIVVKVIGEGKSRRYDVQDPFPDDNTRPGETYRSSASSMVTIPPVGTPLQDYEVGKRVLALYPETTTFYRADVKATLDGGAKVQLVFDDDDSPKVVERRFVLDHKG